MKSTCLVAVLAVLLFATGPCAANNFRKRRVKITNDLGAKFPLIVHCNSGSDDLGPHHLAQGQTYEFSFRPNFWGTTLFYCRFHWTPNDNDWFEIFKAGKDSTSNCYDCIWKITHKGPCRYDHRVKNYVCFPFSHATREKRPGPPLRGGKNN